MERLTWDMFAQETKDTLESRDWESEKVKYVIVWMHAEWCAPCRRLEPDVVKEVEMMGDTREDVKWFDIMVPKDDIEK
jgi:thiol-disulfide isomerase/thioredoxin